MKIHLKFDHEADTTLEALDCPFSVDEINDQLNNLIHKFMEDDKYQQRSHLAELLHNEIDYSAILYMATKYATQQIEQNHIRRMLRNMLGNDEII